MCQSGDESPHVRLMLCHHGTYHLIVGPVTLRLTEDELANVARAILAMSQNHPSLRAKVIVDGNGPQSAPSPQSEQ